MSYSKYDQVEPSLGIGGVRCLRCGRPLINPHSIERVYDPVQFVIVARPDLEGESTPEDIKELGDLIELFSLIF